MLEEIAQDVWATQYPISYMGLSLSTRMTVVRLSHQELILISPVSIDAELKQQVPCLRG